MSRSIKLYALITAGILVLSIIIFRIVAPPPPGKISFASGSEGGAYALTSGAYAEFFAREKVRMTVVPTTGSGDNLELLRTGEVEAAIVQAGVATSADSAELLSLGAVFYEPLWVFFRNETGILDLHEEDLIGLKNLRIAAGSPNSGTRSLSVHMLEQNGVEAELVDLTGSTGAAALRSGEVDVLMSVSGPTAPFVSELLADPTISVLSFPRALAYERRTPYLKRVIFPEGGLDLQDNLPAADIQLIAPVAEIVVRKDMHPALQSLLIDAMVETHRGGTLLSEPGEFPTPNRTDLPLSEEAERYYSQGPSFLRRLFPFGMANFLERAWVLAIPLLTLVFPLVKAAPPLYRWRTRRKIYIWYKDLRELESRGRATDEISERGKIISELMELQAEVGRVEVPESYTDELYRLRSHILFVSQLMRRLNDAALDVQDDESIRAASS